MVSAFELAARNVVRELSKNGELIPVDSLKSSTHFSPYYLVRKKTKSSLFWRSRYIWLNLTLKDILDPSSPEPEVIQKGPFHFNDEVDGHVSGSMEVSTSVQGKISGQTSVSTRTILEVKTLTVSPNTWDHLQKERKLKTPEPSVFQELRAQGENLYVVTEAVKTQKEAILKRSRNRAGFGKITIPGATCFQGEGEGHLNTVKTVTVPEGSILAFQVAKLIFRDHLSKPDQKDWGVLLLPDKKHKTFISKGASGIHFSSGKSSTFSGSGYKLSYEGKMSGYSQGDLSPDFCKPKTDNPVTDFEQLQTEVNDEQNSLTTLGPKLKKFLLQALLGLLQSEQGLLDLEDMLEQSLYTKVAPQKVEGLTGDILSNLQEKNGQLAKEPTGAFLYLLGALNALSDIQHQLLIQLLEKKGKILSQEVELVKGILKENFNQTKERTFSLPSELLSFVQDQDKELTLTYGLLGECGLWLSGDALQFTWNPSVRHSLCALYGSLVMLQALLKA
ncbi:gasdermin-D isoform X2 [Dromiciops gliroides]|nr:gasdermin-D isoform X2 [Dromiciops gliroides]